MKLFCRIVFFAVLLLVFFLPVSAAQALETKKVLVLSSEYGNNPAHDMFAQGIQGIFQSCTHLKVQTYAEYLDVSRFGDSSAQARAIADFLRAKYSGKNIDVIITIFPYALDFMLAQRARLFPEVPLVAALLPQNMAEGLEGSPARQFLTGTILGDNISDVMDGALSLLPHTKRIALIAGTSPTDRQGERGYRLAFKPYAKKMELVDLTKLSMKDTLARVASLPPDTFVVYSSMLRDGTGRDFIPWRALQFIAEASNAPVFSFSDSYLGHGIVGGRLASFKENGGAAAALALRVLEGEVPASIPFGEEHSCVPAFDWRELKRWGISEKALPPGSVVQFKTVTVWEKHKEKVGAVLFFIAIETILIIALVVNLLGRRRAEIELAASAERYRAVADYTHDWEYWIAPDSTLKYVSPACKRITGYTVQEFVDDQVLFLKIIVPEDRQEWDSHDHGGRIESKPQEIQFRIRTKAGDIRWIEHVCLSIYDVRGNYLGIRASNKDITERKESELRARQHCNELAHVTRVATMGELTSSLAHELNQPLAAVSNYASAALRLLSRGEPDLHKAQEALKEIVRDNRRAALLIRRIMDFVKKKNPSYCPVYINLVIQELLGFIHNDAILRTMIVETELAPGLPVVPGDRMQLQQVLLNLMLNALDAMSQAGQNPCHLVIRTERAKNGGVNVSIQDFGPGIDETHREKLFEPFHTTKPGGMGMGLAICARIIQAHGGTIQAENNPDKGATFCFTLPLYHTGAGRLDAAC